MYEALRDAGIPEELVPRIERALSTLIFGFAVSEVGGRFVGDAPEDVRRDFSWIQEAVFEMIRAAAAGPA